MVSSEWDSREKPCTRPICKKQKSHHLRVNPHVSQAKQLTSHLVSVCAGCQQDQEGGEAPGVLRSMPGVLKGFSMASA